MMGEEDNKAVSYNVYLLSNNIVSMMAVMVAKTQSDLSFRFGKI
jgi:hypothetical protein